jgi:ABC-type cobalamin transport system ATPase subunit
MIAQAHQQHPELSIEHLCELFSISRSWYYERSSQLESAAEEIALRDQIERIIREFSGYGYRRVTHAEA